MNELESIVKRYREINIPLIRHIHKTLTENDPATKGVPGKFRTKEVVVRNSALGDFYPAHPTLIDEFMEKMVNTIAETNGFPSLLQAAINHYQFEAIHPFEDGNGRAGRVLINIQLLFRKTLKSAVINLSQYFDKYREKYVKSLRSVSDTMSYRRWVMFFLVAVIAQSKHNRNLISKLRQLKEKEELLVNQSTRSSAAAYVLKHSLNNLYITVPDTAKYLTKMRISGDRIQMARNNIKKLLKLGILEESKKKIGRAEIYEHKNLKLMLMNTKDL